MKISMLKKVVLLSGVFSLMIGYNLQAQDLNSAIQLTKSESYDKAADMYKALIQKEPGNSKNYYYYGENFLLEYFSDTISNSLDLALKSAQETYDKGASANPNDPLNYVGLAKVAVYRGDDAKAEELRAKAKSFLLPYKNLKKINPPAREYALTLAKIAESYAKDGTVDTAKALPFIRQALTIDKKNAEIYLIAGDLYMMAPDGSNAIKNYNLAQFADPQSPTAAMKIGYVYVKGRALQQAIPNFEEAIELNPNYAPAYRELGQLYWRAGRLEQSKANFKKYLELTEGNIPAKTRYVNSLFYAGDYEEVIKNVEEILAVDQSRGYMNRLAGYSYYEKENPDYEKAYSYMETLFKVVDPSLILQKDHHYMARILLKKNQDYTKMLDELNTLTPQLNREKSRLATATAANKPKFQASVDELTAKAADLGKTIAGAKKEIDRAFVEYNKAFNIKRTDPNAPLTPQERSLLNEMATNYYTFRNYDDAARTWARLIDPSKENNLAEYMQVGRAFYNGENYKSADSVFNIVVKKQPDYLPAHVYIARTYSRMDPDTKLGLAKPKFEKILDVAGKDSLKNETEIIEALTYLGYYNMENGNYTKAKDIYTRMINLDPASKDNKIRGYNGIGSLETRAAGQEKTLEGKLGYLSRSAENYQKILEIDPNNASAKSNLKWVQDYQVSVRKGINPNEIKGVVTDMAGAPIPYASVRVKDTAAENLTNGKGEYKFEIPQASEFLVISAKGYKTKEVEITKSRVYNVKLEQ
ncbi:MAG: tetratricopeptide repeat protein [Bacteroidales bacterium]|jgi:tetratricopeptide (TPR) repeat protein|nr:tetratricopeptide repeat protein [Bacteroidales bacterium]